MLVGWGKTGIFVVHSSGMPMKLKPIPLCLVTVLGLHSLKAQDLRSATGDSLNAAGAWVDGSIPTTGDIATWDGSSTLANTIGAAQTFGGLNVSAASGPVAVTGAFNLTLDHATDASTIFDVGATDFTWGATGVGGQFNIVGALSGKWKYWHRGDVQWIKRGDPFQHGH